MKLTPEEIKTAVASGIKKAASTRYDTEYSERVFDCLAEAGAEAMLAKLQIDDKQVRKQLNTIVKFVWLDGSCSLNAEPYAASLEQVVTYQILPIIAAQKEAARQELIGKIEGRWLHNGEILITEKGWQEIKE